MKIKRESTVKQLPIAYVAIGMALSLTSTLSTINISMAQDTDKVTPRIEKDSGLETVEFDTLTGSVKVNLPDDLSASDTISGTVVVEPQGQTKEEIAHNEDTLRGYVVEIEQTQEVQEPIEEKKPEQPVKVKPPVTTKPPCPKPPITTRPPVLKPPTVCNTPPTIFCVPGEKPNYTCRIPPGLTHITVVIRNNSGGEVCRQEVPCNRTPPPCPATRIPTQGTCGTPLRIPGRCDGRVSTSRITVNGNNCPVLAESPRQEICQSPSNTTGRCTIERNECGQITRGTITMLPPPRVPVHHKPPSSMPKPPQTYVFRRTGPFVEQETPSCYADQGNTVNVTESSITWTGPAHIKGDPMVSSTFTFQSPPETIKPGDRFALNASASGHEHVGTQGRYNPNYTWIKPVSGPRSITQSQGYGDPSGTFVFEVEDYLKTIEAALKQHPEYANQVTPEVRNKLPEISLFCPGRINVKITWKYIREK
jgi:hypothetical protein